MIGTMILAQQQDPPKMISFLKLVRIQNLLLIVLLQYFIRKFLLLPMLGSFGILSSISDMHFNLLVIATVCIAAAGYIINDYFDLRMDYVNKPNQVIVGKSIKRRVAMMLHILLSSIGVLICFYIAISMHIWIISVIPLLTVGLLWFYSTDYKRQFLIGNIIISLLTVFPILFVMIFEGSLFQAFFSAENKEIAILIFKVIGYYAIIVCSISLIASIIKDIKDVAGDRALQCKTMPIVIGVGLTKLVLSIIVAFVLFALFYIQNLQLSNNAFIPLIYILFGIQVPLIISLLFLLFSKSDTSVDWSYKIISFVMITGVFAIPVLYYFPGN